MAATETEQLQHDHQPGDMPRQRIPETGAVRQDEVGLELRKPIVRNARAGEEAEARVDAVDRLPAGNDAIHRGGRFRDPLHR